MKFGLFVSAVATPPTILAFQQAHGTVAPARRSTISLFSSAPSDVSSADQSLDDLKADLVSVCTRSNKPTLTEVQTVVRELEDKAEQVRGSFAWVVVLILEPKVG